MYVVTLKKWSEKTQDYTVKKIREFVTEYAKDLYVKQLEYKYTDTSSDYLIQVKENCEISNGN